MFKHSPNGKGIMAPVNYTPWFLAPIEQAWFYKRFFNEVVMVKNKNAIGKDKIVQLTAILFFK